MTRGPYQALSVEHLYYHAVSLTQNGHPDDGVSLPTILSALSRDGQCFEGGWPYLGAVPADLSFWAPPSTATPNHRCLGSIGAGGLDEIVAMLDLDCPVVIALLLGTQFYNPVGGVVETTFGETDTDYHAVLAIGHGHAKARRFILVRNSWGSGWGVAGHAWLAAEYLKPRLYAFARMEKAL